MGPFGEFEKLRSALQVERRYLDALRESIADAKRQINKTIEAINDSKNLLRNVECKNPTSPS